MQASQECYCSATGPWDPKPPGERGWVGSGWVGITQEAVIGPGVAPVWVPNRSRGRGLSQVRTRLYWRQEHTRHQMHVARHTPCFVHRKLCWPSRPRCTPATPTQPVCTVRYSRRPTWPTLSPPQIPPRSSLSPLDLLSPASCLAHSECGDNPVPAGRRRNRGLAGGWPWPLAPRKEGLWHFWVQCIH